MVFVSQSKVAMKIYEKNVLTSMNVWIIRIYVSWILIVLITKVWVSTLTRQNAMNLIFMKPGSIYVKFLPEKGSYECECYVGFVGDGFRECINDNECLHRTDSCPDNAYCIDTIGSYECECYDGYTDIGAGFAFKCKNIDECEMEAHRKGQTELYFVTVRTVWAFLTLMTQRKVWRQFNLY